MSEETEVFKCEFCGVEYDSLQKVSVHKVHCKKKAERKERVPFGVPARRFNAPEDPDYVYHVFNDNWRKEPGRIQRAVAAGYEMVDHARSGESVGTNDDGSEINGVLMKIPRELYEEDQAMKQKEVDKVDEQIYRKDYRAEGGLRYRPGGGTKVEVKQTG